MLHALLTDCGLPETDRFVGVELMEGNWSGSSGDGVWLFVRERPWEDEKELEREPEPEVERERGLPAAKPASMGSGLRRGDICIFDEEDEDGIKGGLFP